MKTSHKETPCVLNGRVISRAALTLCCHYYPEGGWGWVVLTAGSAAHFIANGLHWSYPQLAIHAPPAITDWSPWPQRQGRDQLCPSAWYRLRIKKKKSEPLPTVVT